MRAVVQAQLVLHVAVRSAQIEAIVIDCQGGAVTGLRALGFEVHEDGWRPVYDARVPMGPSHYS